MSFETEMQNLLKEVVQLFQEKKKLKKINKRVQRGRAVSIASEFEEKFAILLEKALPDKYSMFVDYPLSYKVAGKKRTKTSFPDIAIIRDGSVLVGIIELKIDLGFLPPDWVDKSKTQFEQLRNTEKVSYKTGIGTNTGNKKELSIGHGIHRAIILLTGQNHSERLPRFLKQDNCFVLSYNVHPNDYAINDSNVGLYVEKMISCQKNISSWRKLAKFLQNNFE